GGAAASRRAGVSVVLADEEVDLPSRGRGDGRGVANGVVRQGDGHGTVPFLVVVPLRRPGPVPGRERMARPGAVPDGRKGADARVPPARATSTPGGEVEAAAAAGVVGAGGGGQGPSPAVRAAEARGHDADGCAGRAGGGAPLGASAQTVRFVREGRDTLRGVNYSYSNAVQATRPPE